MSAIRLPLSVLTIPNSLKVVATSAEQLVFSLVTILNDTAHYGMISKFFHFFSTAPIDMVYVQYPRVSTSQGHILVYPSTFRTNTLPTQYLDNLEFYFLAALSAS